MTHKKSHTLLIVLATAIVTVILMTTFQKPSQEVTQEPVTPKKEEQVAKDPVSKKDEAGLQVAQDNQRLIKHQLEQFILVFYSEDYAKSNHKTYKDYVTPAFYERTEKARNKKTLDTMAEKTSTTFDGVSFYTALGTDFVSRDEVTVLTTINLSRRSETATDLNRSFLLEMTLKQSDAWRVDRIAEKKTNPY